MEREEKKIGLALSGGGMRAAVFHLGVLKYLAQKGMLKQVHHISSVSGASICVGLIYGCNDNKWPSDFAFLNKVLPCIKAEITQRDIQWSSLLRLLVEPFYWDKKVNLLANVMERKWRICCCLQELPSFPKWTINTTAYETGKDFRISRDYMGEKEIGYVDHPRFRLSHAMAASAGFPVLIGPYKLKTKDFEWQNAQKYSILPQDRVLHLWDGGVYDNMGLDPLFHIGSKTGFTADINYLIVSNASGNIEHKTRRFGYSIENLKRLLDINMDQVNSLKSRSVISFFQKNHNGAYLKIGTPVQKILSYVKMPYEQKEHMIQESLSPTEVERIADYKTSLEKMSEHDFQSIMQHGYEVARCSLRNLKM